MARRNALADANERIRSVRNSLYQVEQEVVLPLRNRVAELERDNAVLTKQAERASRTAQIYRDAVQAHVNLLVELLASGKAT